MRFLLLALLLAAAAAVRAQPSTIHDEPLSERRVSYRIDATLEDDARTLRGQARVTWRNPDRVPVDELQFHLYLNAFKDENSTFMRESGGRFRQSEGFEDDDAWGGIDVTRLQIAPDAPPDLATPAPAGSLDLTERIRFIQPDDANPDDRTVIAVTLPVAVGPGETVALDVDFEARFPEIFARTGWAEKGNGKQFVMGAQWFPKLGVYEVPGQRYVPADAPRGQWNTHQFHANSEFYADFGTYEVTLTVPEGYVVGATGVRTAEAEGEGRRTVTYRADDVHDFAWTASNDFLVFTDRWRHVDLRLLLQPEHAGQAERHFAAAKTALDYFDEWVGEYPYTTLTLVDGIGQSNGMEYPTLVTCGTFYGIPSWLRVPLEVVTIHEFGHQYFYGMLASNEFEEAWLDEGMNSYLETRIMDTAYGPGSVLDLPGLRISDGALQRLQYTKTRPTRGAVFTKSWEYAYRSDYGRASYAKPATLMNTLERHLGWETMQEILQTYYERWRFRHPTTRDLIDVAEEVSGEQLDWFFDAYVYGTVAVDYAVETFSNRMLTAEADSSVSYEASVVVKRLEEGVFPQTLRLRFADGTTEDLAWDGRDEWKEFTVVRPARLVEAYLDPENDVWLDLNRLNNRRAFPADDTLARKLQLKFASWIQVLFHLL